MSLAKIVVTGKVVRNPEKRYTTNNIPITGFSIDISKNDPPIIVRVIAKGKLAESAAQEVQKDSLIVLEGRLQTNMVKESNGTEKKIVEIDAIAIEVMGTQSASSAKRSANEEAADINDFINIDDISGDDLLGDDEIPF